MKAKSIKKSALLILSLTTLIVCVNPAVAITWSDNLSQLTDYPYFDGAPSITQASNGKILIVWSRDVDGYFALYYTTSSDLGTTWSQAMNLTATQDMGDNVGSSIIESANGTIWVFWSSNRRISSPPPPDSDF